MTRTLYTAEVTDPTTGRVFTVEAASPVELEQKLEEQLTGDYPERDDPDRPAS